MIIIRTSDEIEKIRESSVIVADVLEAIRGEIKAGVTTRQLDVYAEELARQRGASPAFKGYRGYPYSLCISVNEVVVHGMPSERRLKEGDIVSLDFGVCYHGYYGDAAITVPVGKVSDEALRLMRITEEALYCGIEAAKPGNRLGDISAAVQQYVEAAGFSVVRDFVGHGIGTKLHEDPQIPNFGVPGRVYC